MRTSFLKKTRSPLIGGPKTSCQYQTFSINNQTIGIPLFQVQEMKNFSCVIPVPSTSDYVKGVMNLRGLAVPVADLRWKLNIPLAEYDRSTVVVVVSIRGQAIGLIVDSVSEVLDIAPESIESAPNFGQVDRSLVIGLTKSKERVVTLLDVERLLFD